MYRPFSTCQIPLTAQKLVDFVSHGNTQVRQLGELLELLPPQNSS
jgi:hypothetical protein